MLQEVCHFAEKKKAKRRKITEQQAEQINIKRMNILKM